MNLIPNMCSYQIIIMPSVSLARAFISSPEPKAQWWAYRIGRPLSSVCMHVVNIFKHLPLKNHWANQSNFIWSLHGMGERKFVQLVQVTWPRWPPCPYMVKTLKNFFSGTKRLMTLKFGLQHRVLEYYQVCSNDDPGLILTYFTARSNLVPYAFIWEKGKTMDFQKLFLHGMEERKFIRMVQITWPIWPPCPYMVKTLKNLLLWKNVGMQHWVPEYNQFIQAMTLGWPWSVLWQGQIWSLMLLYGKKVKQWIFQKLFKSVISKLVDAVN